MFHGEYAYQHAESKCIAQVYSQVACYYHLVLPCLPCGETTKSPLLIRTSKQDSWCYQHNDEWVRSNTCVPDVCFNILPFLQAFWDILDPPHPHHPPHSPIPSLCTCENDSVILYIWMFMFHVKRGLNGNLVCRYNLFSWQFWLLIRIVPLSPVLMHTEWF